MSIFRNKTAIVSGCASGLGKTLCEELARRGATVLVTGLTIAEVQPVADAINAAGGNAVARQMDVRRRDEIQSAIDFVKEHYGRLDYFFNNAGVAYIGEFEDASDERVESVLQTNAVGPVFGSLYAYRAMKAQGGGHIVNVASMAGIIPTPHIAVYSATKHAVVGLSASIRTEGEIHGIKVSVVCMGLVKSEMLVRADIPTMSAGSYEKLLRTPPWETIRAVNYILRGVERNSPYIVMPFYARIMWWIQRLSPALFVPMARASMVEFRKTGK